MSMRILCHCRLLIDSFSCKRRHMCCTFIDEIKQHFIRKRKKDKKKEKKKLGENSKPLFLALNVHREKDKSFFFVGYSSSLRIRICAFIRNSLTSRQTTALSLSCCYTVHVSVLVLFLLQCDVIRSVRLKQVVHVFKNAHVCHIYTYTAVQDQQTKELHASK